MAGLVPAIHAVPGNPAFVYVPAAAQRAQASGTLHVL